MSNQFDVGENPRQKVTSAAMASGFVTQEDVENFAKSLSETFDQSYPDNTLTDVWDKASAMLNHKEGATPAPLKDTAKAVVPFSSTSAPITNDISTEQITAINQRMLASAEAMRNAANNTNIARLIFAKPATSVIFAGDTKKVFYAENKDELLDKLNKWKDHIVPESLDRKEIVNGKEMTSKERLEYLIELVTNNKGIPYKVTDMPTKLVGVQGKFEGDVKSESSLTLDDLLFYTVAICGGFIASKPGQPGTIITTFTKSVDSKVKDGPKEIVERLRVSNQKECMAARNYKVAMEIDKDSDSMEYTVRSAITFRAYAIDSKTGTRKMKTVTTNGVATQEPTVRTVSIPGKVKAPKLKVSKGFEEFEQNDPVRVSKGAVRPTGAKGRDLAENQAKAIALLARRVNQNPTANIKYADRVLELTKYKESSMNSAGAEV